VVFLRALRVLWRGRPFSWLDKVVLGTAGLGLGCIAEGAWVEPYWPEVTHTVIDTPKLAAGEVVRLVHLSDLHCDAKVRLEEQLPALVAAQRPDGIVFTGDAINSPDGVPVLRKLMTALAKVAPTYVVRGNWDMAPIYFWPQDLYQGTGVQEVAARPRQLGKDVWIGGMPYQWDSDVEVGFKALPASGLRIFLYHLPDEVEKVKGRADVYLAGHTHGGQVRLPFYGALITMSRFGKRYEWGRYEVDGTTLYVNRGIGMEGSSAPRVRFWCRPEIGVIELRGRGAK
jgi:predicted MPP superfamily phosphohydrolase